MLIKEYRIPLPLTVEEYRIAQLYMIALHNSYLHYKCGMSIITVTSGEYCNNEVVDRVVVTSRKKSREESSGAGSGVEILINEPYTDGPGGQGQYTRKIYHVGSHLPGWIKGILPKTALMVEEEAWNAYPYTKTRYTCPFVEKFSLEIETYYYSDNGHQENVFNLTGSDLRNRIVDVIDVVKDHLYGTDYVREEDPLYYVSEKSGRGPLTVNWLEEYWEEVKGKPQPLPNGKALMCAYKLCRVEFRYWGMQTKIERFIHDTGWLWNYFLCSCFNVALRKTMLRAHRQAWAWQDEWHGLTMEDIREIERQTQLALKRKMGQIEDEIDEDDNLNNSTVKEDPCKTLAATFGSIEVSEDSPLMGKNTSIPTIQTAASSDADLSPEDEILPVKRDEKWQQPRNLHSPSSSSIKSFDLQVANWRIESLGRDSESPADDEYFDCEDMTDSSSLAKWSSVDLLTEEDADTPSPSVLGDKQDANVDMAAKKSDVTTFRGAFEMVMRQHYPSLIGHIAIRLVSCPSICTEGLGILSSLSPYSFDVSPSCIDVPQITHDSIPIGAIPILASSTSDYAEAVSRTITAANAAYQDFIKSEEGQGFSGQVCLVADSMGSILAYDSLCRTSKYCSRHGSENSILDDYQRDDVQINETGYLTAPSPRRRSSSTSDHSGQIKLEFDVTDFFMFGSPLALVLAYRKISAQDEKANNITRPSCLQVYNMFHPTDPVAARLEPLLSARFSILPPVNVSRYAKYPLGNGQPYHLLEILQTNPQMFNDTLQPRRLSEVSIQSTVSGLIDNIPLQAINACKYN
ncbi:hypothetical protein NQ315_004186 [Exocentrus adspersus]|uniref:DDHD domain-containing protein n=1 Tax=Exocentrus adspersus TaxID=1586481 RepID=A0AAV8W708_9CUCU|nr:hypothetical protein NQ315_004186 [Exocentrus adspersus]